MKNTARRKKISFVNLLVAVFVFLNRTRLKRKNGSMLYLDASYYIHVDSLRWGLYVDSHNGIFVSRFIQKHSDTTNILDASAGFWHKSTIIGIHVSSALRTMQAALFFVLSQIATTTAQETVGRMTNCTSVRLYA